jgi:hypothetical protein
VDGERQEHRQHHAVLDRVHRGAGRPGKPVAGRHAGQVTVLAQPRDLDVVGERHPGLELQQAQDAERAAGYGQPAQQGVQPGPGRDAVHGDQHDAQPGQGGEQPAVRGPHLDVVDRPHRGGHVAGQDGQHQHQHGPAHRLPHRAPAGRHGQPVAGPPQQGGHAEQLGRRAGAAERGEHQPGRHPEQQDEEERQQGDRVGQAAPTLQPAPTGHPPTGGGSGGPGRSGGGRRRG